MQLRAKTPLGWVIRGCLGFVALGLVGVCMLVGLGMFVVGRTTSGPNVASEAATPAASQPAEQPDAAAAPVQVSAAGELIVTSISAYKDRANYLHIVGTITNHNNQARGDIELEVRVEDAAGKSMLKESGDSIASAAFEPLLSTPGPGEAAPFAYVYDIGDEQADHYDVKIKRSKTISLTRPNVQVAGSRMIVKDSGDAYIVGELINMGATPVSVASLAGAAVDAQGVVVDVAKVEDAATYLAAAGDAQGFDRTPFQIPLSASIPSAGEWATATYVEAQAVDPRPAYTVSVSDAGASYTDAQGYFHVVGTIKNGGPSALGATLVAGVYAADGMVLAADTMNVPFDTLAPGAELPYDFSFNLSYGDQNRAAEVARSIVRIDPGLTEVRDVPAFSMTTTDDALAEEQSIWYATGSVVNPSDQPIVEADVVVAIFDPSGKLLGVAATQAFPDGDTIGKGETASYKTYFYAIPGLDMKDAVIKTYVQGYVGY
jgi:hypothetical protein